MAAQFKKHGKLSIPKTELIKIAEISSKNKHKKSLVECKGEIYLTETNRLNYVYKINPKNNRKVEEIISVSYSIRIHGKWITIIYYDSTHNGVLHRHITISLNDSNSDSPTMNGVRQKGTQHRLLTWAMRDLFNNYLHYKENFLKRSNIAFNDIVDLLDS